MEGFMILLVVFYILLGYGYSRTVRRTNSTFGNDVGNAFISLLLWPVFLVFAALNDKLYD